MSTPLKIQIVVDDDGSVKIRQFGQEAEKAGRKGETSFKRTGKTLDEMSRKTASATSHVLKLAAAAVSIGALYMAYRKASRALDEYITLSGVQISAETKLEAVLKATGYAAGYNIEQLKQMAGEMQRVTTTGDEVTLSGMAILATFKQIRGEGFERATMAALDMAEVMDGDLKGSIVMIGKALNDPIANLSAMSRAGVQFTKDQKDMVKQLWESGQTMEAQNIILKELESQFGGTAKAARETFPGALKAAGNALGDVKEEVGFLITKNEAFMVLLSSLEEMFISWSEAIKNNKADLMDFTKTGLVALVSGMETSVLAVGYLIKTMQGLSMEWLVMKKAFLSVDVLAQKFKVWANEGEKSEKKLRMELVATTSAYNDVVQAILTLEQSNVDTEKAVFNIHTALGKLKTTLIETDAETKVLSSTTNEWNAINKEIEINLGAGSGAIEDMGDVAGITAKEIKHLENALEKLKKAALAKEITAAWKTQDMADWVRAGTQAVNDMEREFGEYMSGLQEDVGQSTDLLDELDEALAGIGDGGSLFDGSIFGDDANQGVNNLMKSLGDMYDMYGKLAEREKEIAEFRKKAEAETDHEKQTKAFKELKELETQYTLHSIGAQLEGFAQLFGAIKNMYAENSAEHQRWAMIEKATAIASILLKAAQAIINAGASGDGYTAIARMAAMAAAVGAVLSQVGLSMGGGGGGGGTEPAKYTAGSTLYGVEEGAISESLSNSFEMLGDIELDQYGALLDIYLEMRRLNANISGLVTSVVRTGSVGSLSSPGVIDSPTAAMIENTLVPIFAHIGSSIMLDPIIYFVQKALGGILGDIGSWLFGGDVEFETLESGLMQFVTNAKALSMTWPTMGEIMSGEREVEVRPYLWYEQQISGGAFGEDDNQKKWLYGDKADGPSRLITNIIKSIGETMLDLADILGFGEDTIQKIKDYAVELGKIDLKNLNAAQIQEALSAWFSDFADKMAGDVFGELLERYQKADEGLFETAIRLAVEKEMIMEVLDMTGQAFAGTALEAVHFSQGLIEIAGSLDDLAEAAKTYFEEYFTEAEKQEWLLSNLADAYEAIGIAMPATREEFKALVESIDLTTDSGQELYVALLEIAAATDAYYDVLEKANESIIDAQRKLTDTVNEGTISDIEARYGWTIDEGTALDIIQQFINATPEEISAYAEAMGVTVDQLVDDIMTLADIFGWFDEEVQAAAEAMSQFDESLSNITEWYNDAMSELMANSINMSAEEYASALNTVDSALRRMVSGLVEEYQELNDEVSDYIRKAAAKKGLTGYEDYTAPFDEDAIYQAIIDGFTQGFKDVKLDFGTVELEDNEVHINSEQLPLKIDPTLIPLQIDDVVVVIELIPGAPEELPTFALGGIVSSATTAVIGEAGPEAVIPLVGGAVPVMLSGNGFPGASFDSSIWNKLDPRIENLSDALKSLYDSLMSVVDSIRYSNLNLALPKEKAEEAAQEYSALLSKALTTGATIEDVDAYLKFIQTYLTQSQNAYKSSQKYQDIYSDTMSDTGDVYAMRENILSGNVAEPPPGGGGGGGGGSGGSFAITVSEGAAEALEQLLLIYEAIGDTSYTQTIFYDIGATWEGPVGEAVQLIKDLLDEEVPFSLTWRFIIGLLNNVPKNWSAGDLGQFLNDMNGLFSDPGDAKEYWFKFASEFPVNWGMGEISIFYEFIIGMFGTDYAKEWTFELARKLPANWGLDQIRDFYEYLVTIFGTEYSEEWAFYLFTHLPENWGEKEITDYWGFLKGIFGEESLREMVWKLITELPGDWGIKEIQSFVDDVLIPIFGEEYAKEWAFNVLSKLDDLGYSEEEIEKYQKFLDDTFPEDEPAATAVIAADIADLEASQTSAQLITDEISAMTPLVTIEGDAGGLQKTIDSVNFSHLSGSFATFSGQIGGLEAQLAGMDFPTLPNLESYQKQLNNLKLPTLPPLPPGFALGGIATGPESGYIATLHGTELVVSPKTTYPATVQGDSGGNAGPIHITVEVGGEEFNTIIDERSDNIRVRAERQKLGPKRMFV